METSAHDVARSRSCRLDGCPNELGPGDPTRGRYANMCDPCRKGVTIGQQLGIAGSASAGSSPYTGPKAPAASFPGVSLETKAKAIVPFARDLERKARTSKAARAATAQAVRDFSKALTELRDAAAALIPD